MQCCGYVIYNERQGDLICENCGRIERYLKVPSIPLVQNFKHDFIETVCSNNHISKIIEEEAIHQYYKSNPQNNKEAFAAYCIYFACNKHNVPRSLIEIARICFININDITKFNTVDINILPSDLAERVFNKLDITSYSLKRDIKKLSDILFNDLLRCSPPQSALAVAILTACNKERLDLKIIAQACDTSASCLRRLSKIYKNETLNLWSHHIEQSNQTVFYSEQNGS